MKTIYSVNITTKTESTPIFTTENEQEARARCEAEKANLAKNEAADITGWQDHDQAWGDVYTVELVKSTIDEYDGDVENMETLDETPYYWR